MRDLAREPMPGEIRLQWWREVLGGERQSEARAHPVAAALRETLMRYKLAASPLLGLIDARTFDLYDEPMATLADLQRYGEQTDAAVFAMAGRNSRRRPADDDDAGSGTGFRDGRHAERLLPNTLRGGNSICRSTCLDRHGVERESIFAGEFGEALRAALAEMRQQARRHLAAARNGARGRTAGHSAGAAAGGAGRSGAAAPWTTRLRSFDPLPAWRRQWMLWRAARDPRRIFSA